tara:strand:+ start:3146 stop:3742 length:597 start_codon:yes stop_codon:yes gene_type:complete
MTPSKFEQTCLHEAAHIVSLKLFEDNLHDSAAWVDDSAQGRAGVLGNVRFEATSKDPEFASFAQRIIDIAPLAAFHACYDPNMDEFSEFLNRWEYGCMGDLKNWRSRAISRLNSAPRHGWSCADGSLPELKSNTMAMGIFFNEDMEFASQYVTNNQLIIREVANALGFNLTLNHEQILDFLSRVKIPMNVRIAYLMGR